MKTHLLLAALLTLATPVFAGDDHGHSHAKEAGPNQGRLLTAIDPHAEFLVTPERKIRITFLDAANKPTAPAAQTVTVITGERSAPTRLTFVREGDALVSEQPLPAGENLPAVVQIKVTPDEKTAVEKFHVNLSTCPGCQLPEYACTCAH